MSLHVTRMTRSSHGLDTDHTQPWWVNAACRGHDPELWSHLRGWRSLPNTHRKLTLHPSEAQAIAICRQCPVIDACYRDALAATDPVTGGVIRAGLFWPVIRRDHRPTSERRST